MVNAHANGDTPDYIKALLVPPTSGGASRRAWSIDVESTWVPFFTATNVMGETTLPEEVLGAPIRLAKSPDGDVRFTKTGRPIMRVAPELNAQIGIVRENFVAGLQAYTGSVMEERPDAYGLQVKANQDAGNPLIDQDGSDVLAAVEAAKAALEEECAPAEEAAPEPETPPTTTGRGSRSGNTSETPQETAPVS